MSALPDPIPAALVTLDRLTEQGPLTELALRDSVFPLFSRVRARTEIYLANHSLGRPLDRTALDIQSALDLWYTDMDGAWSAWMDAQNRFRALTAQLLGLSRPDAVVPKTSAGQGVRAVLNAIPASDSNTPPHIVTTTGEFDSTDFILKTYEHRGRAIVTRVPADAQGVFHGEHIANAITPQTDLVAISQVIFATGQVVEGLDLVIQRAHEHGALVLLDVYHSAGVLPLSLESLGADFAVGGSYKYTRGGPGACWLAIHPRHLSSLPTSASKDDAPATGTPVTPEGLTTLDTGWFAKYDTFGFTRTAQPVLARGGDAWLESTPSFLAPYQALAGLELTLGIGLDRLRAYSLDRQQRLAQALTDQGVPLHNVEPHGAYLLIPTTDGPSACKRLKKRGINTDARTCPTTGKHLVRLCPDLLTTRDEIARAAPIIGDVLSH